MGFPCSPWDRKESDITEQLNGTDGLSRQHSGKVSACQNRRYRRCGFDPCFGKIPWSS